MQYPNYIRQAPHNAAGERYRGSRWLIKQRKETFSGRESTFLGMGTTFFRKAILTNSTFGGKGVESEFCRSSLGRRSVE